MEITKKCLHCQKEYKINEDQEMEDTGYCPSCKKLQDEQNKRCAEMNREFPDEAMDWKEFEEDILGLNYN